MDTESPPIFNDEASEVGESPVGSHCGRAGAVPRFGILQIPMGALHSNAHVASAKDAD
jgi:hypothetical protein